MPLRKHRAGRACAAYPSSDDLCAADWLVAGPKRRPAIRHLAAARGRGASMTGIRPNIILAAMNIDTFAGYFAAWLDY